MESKALVKWTNSIVASRFFARTPSRILRMVNNNQQKKQTKICKIVDFAVPAGHKIKLKESEKRDMYRNLARELKKTLGHKGENYTYLDWCFWHGN